MKKFMITLMVMMTMLVSSAKGMSYELAHENAAFIADKMAYELDLTEMQYESVYEVYFDYFTFITPTTISAVYWNHLCIDLKYILSPVQYRLFERTEYFYHPVYYSGLRWHFRIYNRYNRGNYYFSRPRAYVHYVAGAHSRNAYADRRSHYERHPHNAPIGGGMRSVMVGRRNDTSPMPPHITQQRHNNPPTGQGRVTNPRNNVNNNNSRPTNQGNVSNGRNKVNNNVNNSNRNNTGRTNATGGRTQVTPNQKGATNSGNPVSAKGGRR